ncbi:hypothetical protein DB347_13165 [Opitutaceae bacterium EW11]|nr:hypothetical protein DB347_13165 [Opitutaceae bacterium EW11]
MVSFRAVASFAACGLFVSLSHAAAPALLATAVQKLVEQDDQWAYTQVYRRADKPEAETIARFDPSRPAGAHWELLKLRGKTPTSAEASKWCERREKQVNQSDARAAVDLLDIDQAKVAEETGTKVRYEVPLKDVTIGRIPAANFIVFAEVDREDQSLQRFSIFLRQAIRFVGGIAAIESAQGEVVFTSLDESAATRPTHIVASGTGQALFKRVNRSAEIIYTDQRRVKG